MSYNGYKNYETWNISLWFNNDEVLYNMALEFIEGYDGNTPYEDFREYLKKIDFTITPDDVSLWDSGLDIEELDVIMNEMVEE